MYIYIYTHTYTYTYQEHAPTDRSVSSGAQSIAEFWPPTDLQ